LKGFLLFTSGLNNDILFYYLILVKCFLDFLIKKCIHYFIGNKKIFSTRVDKDRIKNLKHLAIDTYKSLGTLLEEAIRELL